MEPWQVDHVRKNKAKLLEYTRCHSQLLCQLKAVGVLSTADVVDIESKSNRHSQASCFYDIAETRTNGYVELLKALNEYKQDGAVTLLMAGPIKDMILQLRVSFLGRDHLLSELLEERELSEINEKLKSLNLTKYITLISECNSKVIPLLKDTIPNPDKFYIPRYLVTRKNLDKKIFQTDCQDVFVFTNYTRAQLSQLASVAKCHTASSKDQIEKLTSRFILLEDTNHWKNICDISEGIPVHLITYEKDNYILTNTTGGSRALNKFLHCNSEGAQDWIREDDAASLEKENNLCICDLPGMGKSLLLANLARIFSEYNPNEITAFISLPGVAQFLTQNPELNNSSSSVEVLALLIAPTELSGYILCMFFKKQVTRVCLYLDGLDEVPTKLLPQVKSFLFTLKEEKWIRVHVTARTHMRHELESILGVIPYDIVPFTRENQLQFLTNFWKNQDPSSNETRLAEFANYCLDKWKGNMTEQRVQITGIPLQCRLLAEVYSKQALWYARESVQLNETEITETSLLQLYISYLKIGLERVQNQISSIASTQLPSVEDTLLFVEQFHIWEALKLLYPKFADVYAKRYHVKTALEVGEIQIIMSMGFLLPEMGERESSVKFVHRTFAEFLTARFFASILSKIQPAKNIDKAVKYFEKLTLEFFFQKVANHKVTGTADFDLLDDRFIGKMFSPEVHQFSSYLVMKFVNDELINHSAFNSIVPNAFLNSVSAKSCYCMIISTLVQRLPLILRLVKFALAGLSKFKLLWYRRYFSKKSETGTSVTRQMGFLFVSARFANVVVARELFDILSQIFHLDLYKLHNHRPMNRRTPLHFAVQRGDYEVVEHVLQYSTSCDEEEMLEYMTRDTCENRITVLQNKARICQLLFSRSSLSKPLTISNSILLYHKHRIHPYLIKSLLQNGMHMEHEDCSRLLIRVAYYLQAHELYDLFIFFNANVNNEPTFHEIDFPLFDVLKFFPEATKLLQTIPSVQWDAEDEHGNTLIHISSAAFQSMSMVQKCLENDVNVNSKNKFGWTCLHIAAGQRNLQLMYYLLEKGVSITEKTNAGDTPLHLFFLNSEASYTMFEDMALNEEVLQLLSHKNEEGRTILHNFLNDGKNELGMSSETLSLLMGSLRIKANETDNAGKNLLDAAIHGKKDESIIKLLRQKLADA